MKVSNRKDLKILFMMKDSSPNEIARRLKVNHQAVYMVMSGETTSKRIAAEIEKVLGMPIEEVQKAYRKRYKPPVTAA